MTLAQIRLCRITTTDAQGVAYSSAIRMAINGSVINVPMTLAQMGQFVSGMNLEVPIEIDNPEGLKTLPTVTRVHKKLRVRIKAKVTAEDYRAVAYRLGAKRETAGWIFNRSVVSLADFKKDEEGRYVTLRFYRDEASETSGEPKVSKKSKKSKEADKSEKPKKSAKQSKADKKKERKALKEFKSHPHGKNARSLGNIISSMK